MTMERYWYRELLEDQPTVAEYGDNSALQKHFHFLTMFSLQYIVKPNSLPANLAAVSANLSLIVDACRLVNPAITSPIWEDRAAITSRRHAASIVVPASEETVSHRHTKALAAAF